MSTTKHCDECGKKEKEADKEWIHVSVSGRDLEKYGMVSSYQILDLCGQCGKKFLNHNKKFLIKK